LSLRQVSTLQQIMSLNDLKKYDGLYLHGHNRHTNQRLVAGSVLAKYVT
jgi:hypothetical protein